MFTRETPVRLRFFESYNIIIRYTQPFDISTYSKFEFVTIYIYLYIERETGAGPQLDLGGERRKETFYLTTHSTYSTYF